MKAIQPLDIWSNGDTKTAICIKIYISYDDLDSTAMFQYSLCDVNDGIIYQGSLGISAQEYINWGASGDSNAEAYQIVATNLNLTLIP